MGTISSGLDGFSSLLSLCGLCEATNPQLGSVQDGHLGPSPVNVVGESCTLKEGSLNRHCPSKSGRDSLCDPD